MSRSSSPRAQATPSPPVSPSAILEGWELERAARFASVLGGSACTALGCAAGIFTRAQAEAFLAAHPLSAGLAEPRLVPLVPLPDLLAGARAAGYAVGYFEAWDGYSLEAVLARRRARALARHRRLRLPARRPGLARPRRDRDPRPHRAHPRRAQRRPALADPERGADASTTACAASRPASTLSCSATATLADDRRARRGRPRSGESRSRQSWARSPDGDSSGRVDDSHASLTDPDEAAAFVSDDGSRRARRLDRQRPHARGRRRDGRPRSARRHPAGDRRAARRARRQRLPGGGGRRGDRGSASRSSTSARSEARVPRRPGAALGVGAPDASPHDLVGSHRHPTWRCGRATPSSSACAR